MMRRPIVVSEYDAEWPRRFEELRDRLWPAVADVALRVEHIGSTAIPALAAKPIIDMTVVVADCGRLPAIIGRLEPLGYRHCGNLGIEGREAFEHPPDMPRHHLYVCVEGAVALLNHLRFRDHLRQHADMALAYGQLKQRLASESATDVNRYAAGKTGFIIDVLRRAGVDPASLASIAESNPR